MQQPSLFLLRWYGLLVGLVLGFLVSFAGAAALGSRYLAGTPVLPHIASVEARKHAPSSRDFL
ncbi:MAG: hypothetical protein H0U76_02410 [Ktedonobacteraceae bacterium]|nr:hypothetical protein [Ktedonobacteraceae bacterium]